MTYKQEPPFCIQVELSEGCNLYCDFCGLQGIRHKEEKNFKFMSKSTARSLASQMAKLEWNSRIEFAMHGEPTMHPDYVGIITEFRKRLPKNQLMMTSNGGGLLRPPGVVANLSALFDAGLNIFAFDAYEYVKIKDKVDTALGDGQSLPFETHRYPDEPDWSPHSRYGHKSRLFIRVQDISQSDKGTHSKLNNHCGAGAPPEPTVAKCAKPFREISIRWDGNVAICCNDWRGVYKCGNIEDDGLLKVWHGDRMNAARKYLLKGDRTFAPPCAGCNAKSYRVGLLPDKKGQVELPKITAVEREAVLAAVRGKPYTVTIKREWEK